MFENSNFLNYTGSPALFVEMEPKEAWLALSLLSREWTMNRRDSLRSAIFVHSKVLITRVLMFLPDISPWDRTQAHLLSKVGRKIQPPLDLRNIPLKTFQILDFFLSRESGIIYVSHRQDWICQGQQSALQAVQEPRQRAELYRSYQNWNFS